ncbi:MAG: hypothetical protein COB02_04770 [Candidatus Cloacimonadota bacterium]|nr:MAG: hypothetical protein COB02_04770 [Candidatus Cloacimonadota bacterium]
MKYILLLFFLINSTFSIEQVLQTVNSHLLQKVLEKSIENSFHQIDFKSMVTDDIYIHFKNKNYKVQDTLNIESFIVRVLSNKFKNITFFEFKSQIISAKYIQGFTELDSVKKKKFVLKIESNLILNDDFLIKKLFQKSFSFSAVLLKNNIKIKSLGQYVYLELEIWVLVMLFVLFIWVLIFLELINNGILQIPDDYLTIIKVFRALILLLMLLFVMIYFIFKLVEWSVYLLIFILFLIVLQALLACGFVKRRIK